MNELKQHIKQYGKVINDDVLKVDSFLNHQINPKLMKQMGDYLYEYFKHQHITKIVTIETSGIAPAMMCALRFDVPLIFIKKTHPSTMQHAFSAEVFSFTKNKSYTICLDSSYLTNNDHILFIDDFLANGEAFKGAEQIIKQANATIVGVGIIIEKAYQAGHKYIIDQGYNMCSLASISSMKNGKVQFVE